MFICTERLIVVHCSRATQQLAGLAAGTYFIRSAEAEIPDSHVSGTMCVSIRREPPWKLLLSASHAIPLSPLSQTFCFISFTALFYPSILLLISTFSAVTERFPVPCQYAPGFI